MRYYFKLEEVMDANSEIKARREYWTEEQVKQIPLFEETDEIFNDYFGNEHSVWELIYGNEYSQDGERFDSEEQAYDQLQYNLNESLYCYYYDV